MDMQPYSSIPSYSKVNNNTGTATSSITPGAFYHKAPNGTQYSSGAAAGFYSTMLSTFGTVLGVVGTFTCCCNPYRTVDQGFAGVKTKFGKYTETVDPGLHYTNLLTESLRVVDVKMQIEDIPSQSVITKDNVTVLIDSVLYWHVINPFTSVFEVANVKSALIERTQTTLRQIIGSHDLQDSIVNRETIAHEIQDVISSAAKSWGVRIESILIKDIQFSVELQANLSAAALARRLAAARIIQAESEVESAKLLREASDILDSKAAMQIRYLDTLKAMAKEAGSKVIFVPTNSSEGFSTGGSTGITVKPSGNNKGNAPIGNAAMVDVISNM